MRGLLSREARCVLSVAVEPRGWSIDWRSLSIEPRGVVAPPDELVPLVLEEKPVELLLTPPLALLSASLCCALLLRSCERERLWLGLSESKAFLRDDMANVVWCGFAQPSFKDKLVPQRWDEEGM